MHHAYKLKLPLAMFKFSILERSTMSVPRGPSGGTGADPPGATCRTFVIDGTRPRY